MNWNEPVMPWAMGPNYPRWSETLRDGSRVDIRPLHRTDVAKEREFIESLSPQSRRFRFLGQIGEPSAALLEQLTNVDYRHDVAFAAIAADDPEERFVGVSRFSTTLDGIGCECAVAVLDAWQHRGLGTALMTHLIHVARARGVVYMYSLDSADNSAMADLARHMGFSRRPEHDDPTMVVHSLQLAASAL